MFRGKIGRVEPTMYVPLDRESPIPLARQIQAHLERLIREGLLAPGVKLPATRDLARAVGVNRATAVLAYEELAAAGLVRSHVGQGTFVAPRPVDAVPARPPAPAGSPPVDWAALFSHSARIVAAEEERRRVHVPAAGDGDVVSFAGGMPDSGLFPTDAFRRVVNEVLRDEGGALLQYYPGAGYPPLRRYLSTYLLRFGLEARPEEILIVNGSQQGFDLIARTFLDPGDVVAIEQPTYPRAMQVFRAVGAELRAVPWGPDGPDPAALERLLARHAPKLFYCQPSGHNPTGLAMSGEVAGRLLALAARHQLPVVEDGFDPSLHYGPRPPAPLKARDRSGLVLYIGTFSKILFPGLRLGWLPGAAPGLAAGAGAGDRAPGGRQAAGRPAQQRAAAGGRAPLLRAAAAGPARRARGPGVRAAAEPAAGGAGAPDAGGRHVDGASGGLLAAAHAAAGAAGGGPAAAGAGAGRGVHAGRRVLPGRGGRAGAPAVVLLGAGRADRRRGAPAGGGRQGRAPAAARAPGAGGGGRTTGVITDRGACTCRS